MKNRRNYYRILHVQRDAPLEIVKSSYRTLMQKLKAHPDLGGDEWNAALINEAYRVISNPETRAQYDARMQARAERRNSEDTAPAGTAPAHNNTQPDSHPQRCLFCHTSHQVAGAYHDDSRCPTCQSPLKTAAHLAHAGTCGRAVSRIAMHGEVFFLEHWPQPLPYHGSIVNLSPHGLGISAPVSIATGAILKIEGELLSATARVVNCLLQVSGVNSVYHIGAEFLTLEFADMRGTFVSTRI